MSEDKNPFELSEEEQADLERDLVLDGSDEETLKEIAGVTAESDTEEADESKDGENNEEEAAKIQEADASPPDIPFVPTLSTGDGGETGDRLKQIQDAAKELTAKFEVGDIDISEFVLKKSAFDNESVALQLAAAQREWTEKQNAEMKAQYWEWEQKRFFREEKAAIYKDDVLLSALNACVIKLSSNTDNQDKPPEWFLKEADRMVRERFRDIGGKTETGDKKSVVSTKERKPDLTNIPKTLANAPAAELPDDGTGEFVYLDKLPWEKQEREIAKMSEEQRQRYLAS